MFNVFLSQTGLTNDVRRRIMTAVSNSSGTVSAVQSLSEAHVFVASTTLCDDYDEARRLGVSAVTPKFVTKASAALAAAAAAAETADLEPLVKQCSLKVLQGCIVCATALDKEDKDAIDKLTQENGGKYSAVLNMAVTHLITSEEALAEQDYLSEKCAYAAAWKIPIVSTEWLRQCARQRWRLDAAPYVISLPESTASAVAAASKETDFANANLAAQAAANEAAAAATSAAAANSASLSSASSANRPTTTLKRVRSNSSSTAAATATSSHAVLPDVAAPHKPWPAKPARPSTGAMYLESTNVYIGSHVRSDTLKADVNRALLDGSGTLNVSLNRDVTHIIVQPATGLAQWERELVVNLPVPPAVVSPDWLRDSYLNQQQQPFSLYEQPVAPPSAAPAASSASVAIASFNTKPLPAPSVISRPAAAKPASAVPASAVPKKPTSDFADLADLYGVAPAPAAAAPHKTPSVASSAPFFLIDSYFSPAMRQNLSAFVSRLGGIVCASPKEARRGGPKFAIVPFVRGRAKDSYDRSFELRTPYWLEFSDDQKRLVNAEDSIIYRPSKHALPLADFQHLILGFPNNSTDSSTSLYRDHLMKAVAAAGAQVSEDVVDLNHLTHLVTDHPEGKMFTSSQQRSIPCLRLHWLEESLGEGAIAKTTPWLLSTPQSLPAVSQASLSASPRQPVDCSTILDGVCVHFNDSKIREAYPQLTKIITEMGGTIRSTMSNVVTHYLHEHRPNAKAPSRASIEKSLRKHTNPDHKVHIVSPNWVFACYERGCLVKESYYPASYNGSKALPLNNSPPLDRALDGPSSSYSSSYASPYPKNASHNAPQSPRGHDSYSSGSSGRQVHVPKDVMDHENPFSMPPARTIVVTSTKPPQPSPMTVDSYKHIPIQGGYPQSPPPPPADLYDVSPVTQARLPRSPQKSNTPLSPPPPPQGDVESMYEPTNVPARDARPKVSAHTIAQPQEPVMQQTDVQPQLAALIDNLLSTSSVSSLSSNATRRSSSRLMRNSGSLDSAAVVASSTAAAATSAATLPPLFPAPVAAIKTAAPVESLKRSRLDDDGEVTYEDMRSLRHRNRLFSGGNEALSNDGAKVTAEAAPKSNIINGKSKGASAPTKIRRFQLSLVDVDLKPRYFEIIKHLGGEYVVGNVHDLTCTHAIVGSVQRGEKVVASCAAGLWVMREDYLMDSDRAGRFLDEDKYEWGHPDNLQLKPHRPNHDFPLAKACREWRLRIHADELGAPKGSFDGWRILMCVDGDNKDQVDRSGAFQRIFESGKGHVTSMSFFDIRKAEIDPQDFTHAFIIVSHIPDVLVPLMDRGLLLLSTDHIFEFLTNPATDFSRISLNASAKRPRM